MVTVPRKSRYVFSVLRCCALMNYEGALLIFTFKLQLIALLARHHRKKLPKLDHSSFKEIPKEVNILLQSFCTDLSETYASGKEVMYVYFCIFFGLFSGEEEIQSSLCSYTSFCCIMATPMQEQSRNAVFIFL